MHHSLALPYAAPLSGWVATRMNGYGDGAAVKALPLRSLYHGGQITALSRIADHTLHAP
jgi:hypothetical protein